MSTQLQTPFAIPAARRAKYSPRNNAVKDAAEAKRPLKEGTPDTGLRCLGVAPDFSPGERVFKPARKRSVYKFPGFSPGGCGEGTTLVGRNRLKHYRALQAAKELKLSKGTTFRPYVTG
jgi:hypothetical protein